MLSAAENPLYFYDNSPSFHLIHYANNFRSVNCHIKIILLLLTYSSKRLIRSVTAPLEDVTIM